MILHKTSLGTFRKFVPITKIDVSRREVYGVVTAEVPDKDNEVCDYASTKPEYMKWSADIAKASNGKNIGNLREMHGLSAVGAGKALDFDDSAKLVRMGFRVVDDNAWKKCMEGVYTGFSQGGSYVKTWKADGFTHYTARPSEISLVDNPCLSTATFEFIRADGSSEMRKFAVPVPQKDEEATEVLEPKDEKEEKLAEKAEGITDEGGHVCSECGQTIAPKEVKKEETVGVIEPELEGSPEGEETEEETESPEEKDEELIEGEELVDEDLEECSGVAKGGPGSGPRPGHASAQAKQHFNVWAAKDRDNSIRHNTMLNAGFKLQHADENSVTYGHPTASGTHEVSFNRKNGEWTHTKDELAWNKDRAHSEPTGNRETVRGKDLDGDNGLANRLRSTGAVRIRSRKFEEISDLDKVNVQPFKSPVNGQFSYTPDEICGEIQYHNNMARASMLANEICLSEAHQIMACMWEDRGVAVMPPSNPELIAFDPNEVTDLLESVNLPAAVYKTDALQDLIKSATIEVESLLQSVGM